VTIVQGLVGVVLLLCVSFPLFRGHIYGNHDLYECDLPAFAHYAAGLKTGRLHLWNPHLFRGFDQHAEGQVGMCHPYHLLVYALLPFAAAVSLELILPFPLAFVGMYLFLRRRRLSPSAAVFGGLCVSFSTFFFAHLGHMSLLLAHAHLPWMLYCTDILVASKDRETTGALGMAVVLASALLLGRPDRAWVLCLTASAYALAQVAVTRSTPKDISRKVVWFGVAVGLAVVLASVQLLPTFQAAQTSQRFAGALPWGSGFPLNPRNLLQMCTGYFFESRYVGNFHTLDGTRQVYYSNPAEYSAYLGVALLNIAIVLLATFRRRAFRGPAAVLTRFSLLMIGLGLLLMLGDRGQAHKILGFVPFVRQFRVPARYTALVQFGLAILAAAGLINVCLPSLSSPKIPSPAELSINSFCSL